MKNKSPAQLPENNVERIVHEGDRLYFVPKEALPSVPLTAHGKFDQILINIVSIPVPDRQWQVNEEKMPTLRDILLMNRQQNPNGNNIGSGIDQNLNMVEEIKSILVAKLKSNLLRYQAPLMVSTGMN